MRRVAALAHDGVFPYQGHIPVDGKITAVFPLRVQKRIDTLQALMMRASPAFLAQAKVQAGPREDTAGSSSGHWSQWISPLPLEKLADAFESLRRTGAVSASGPELPQIVVAAVHPGKIILRFRRYPYLFSQWTGCLKIRRWFGHDAAGKPVESSLITASVYQDVSPRVVAGMIGLALVFFYFCVYKDHLRPVFHLIDFCREQYPWLDIAWPLAVAVSPFLFRRVWPLLGRRFGSQRWARTAPHERYWAELDRFLARTAAAHPRSPGGKAAE